MCPVFLNKFRALNLVESRIYEGNDCWGLTVSGEGLVSACVQLKQSQEEGLLLQRSPRASFEELQIHGLMLMLRQQQWGVRIVTGRKMVHDVHENPYVPGESSKIWWVLAKLQSSLRLVGLT